MDFHGDRVLLVDVNGRPYIVLRPALEALGLDYSTQLAKLRQRSWAVVGQSPTTGADGKTYQMVTVDVRTFLMLLATVDENRVAEAVRPKLVAYQAEVADAIEAYWTKGAAINPRATSEQIAAALHEHQLRMLAMAHAAKLVDPEWLEAKTRHVLARALGEEPEIDPARRPLTVGEYLEEKGIRDARLRRLAPDFGKWLKAEYRSEYGCNPPIVERFVDNAPRRVCGYTEAHRPLFDAVWETRCERLVVETPVPRPPWSDTAPRRSGSMTRTRRRPVAPRPVREVARAAGLSLEEFAEAVLDGQPRPERSRDQAALLHWLGQSVRSKHPNTPTDELAALMAARLQEMADGGDATAQAMLEAEVRERSLNMARIALALAGAMPVPDPPAVPKPARLQAIAATVVELTGWPSVPFDTVATVYLWLFGDEALYLMGTDMRVEAGLQMLGNRELRGVHVPHPGTGELVLVTWEEILKHADDDRRALEAAQRYEEAQLR